MKGDVYGNQKNKKPLIIGLICGGVILLAVIVIMIVMFLKNNDSKDTPESKKWETIKVTNEVTTEITTEATTEATSEITTEATTEATTETTTEATTEDHAEEEYNEACALFDEGKYSFSLMNIITVKDNIGMPVIDKSCIDMLQQSILAI